MVANAERAEQLLLAKIKGASSDINANVPASGLGFARDLLYNVEAAVTGYIDKHRMPEETVLELMLPRWVRRAAGADLLRQLPGDNVLATGMALFDAALAQRRVRVTWYWDDVLTLAGAASGASQKFVDPLTALSVTDFPDTVQMGLWHSGAHLFLDNGVLDFGIVRDSTLNAVNDYQIMMEGFEGHAFVGIESWWVILQNLCPSGTTAAAKDVSGLCGGNTTPGS
jgi:hypothetical protein